jgi:hypothetical protein
MLYAKLHAPLAVIDGGDSDVAFENGRAECGLCVRASWTVESKMLD